MRYAVVIEKAEGNYSGYVPDLPGYVAAGPTIAAVEAEIERAIQFHGRAGRRRAAVPSSQHGGDLCGLKGTCGAHTRSILSIS